MNVKAHADRGYLVKYLLIGVTALAFGLWHANDALFKYPLLRPLADAYETLQGPLDENGQSAISDGDLQSSWKALTAENGWPDEVPKSNDEINNILLYNYFVGVVFTLIGCSCLLITALTVGKWVELKNDVVSDKKGNSINVKDIVEIDKKRWEKKGLVVLTAKTDGRTKKMILDDLKFERRPVDQILMHIENTAGEDKIINGQTEAHYEALRLEKLAAREARQAELDQMQDQDA